ncbi:MAG: hypothetical protein D6784_07915 [Chloroflexi bacterium]|nr:MAG: hypothetical protein D6784_07915 [Chloroflexota bacterium]
MAKQIEQGKPLAELVKGSLDYTQHIISQAFYAAFARSDEDWFYIEEIFADHLIVAHESLPPDEFYRVPYQRQGETYSFAPREAWEVVELAYRPRTMTESGKSKGRRFVERIGWLELVEAKDANPDGPWQIRGQGITADVVNGNNRRYARHVLEAAVRELRTHLRESAGQGRLLLTGEADHPQDKGYRTPLLQETIINWTDVEFRDGRVWLAGKLLGTRIGKDVRAQMLGGVRPDISQRGYGRSILIEEDGREIEEVVELTITGYDLVAEGSDPHAGVTMVESRRPQNEGRPQTENAHPKEEKTMNEELQKAIEEFVETYVSQLNYTDKTKNQIRKAVLSAKPATVEAAKEMIEAKHREYEAIMAEAQEKREKLLKEQEKELAELRAEQQKRQVAEHIQARLQEMKYPDEMKAVLAEALKAAEPPTVEAADALIEAKQKEYDALMAQMKLAERGCNRVQVVGPVLETETGTPEFARPAFDLVERLAERKLGVRRDFRQATTPNEIFTRRYLEAFDRTYRHQLIEEARRYQQFLEAETTADLSLPYSVSRAIIEEAVPELVALSIFDFGLEDTSPTRIYFEAYSEETGAAPTVTDESFTSAHDSWVQLANRRLRPGSVTVTSNPAGTTYTEYADYVIDYANGKIMVLSTGSMADATGFLIDYTYDKVRAGENAAIQRGKGSLSYQTVELMADRLASLVTDEAITFARTQLGWDAVTRTLNMVIRELREMIDTGAIRLALASAVRSGNSGGTWNSASDPISDLVQKIGLAKAAIITKNYMPRFVLLSPTNAERLSNWDGFKRDGFPDAVLNAAGFVGQVKGLPVFMSNHMPDSHALVGHTELVQHRVLSTKPMTLKGPFQAYNSGNLVAAQEYYVEEYNATESLIPDKGGFVTIA